MEGGQSVECDNTVFRQSALDGSTEDVPVCRICLATDRKLYDISEYKALCKVYEILTGFLWSGVACGACTRRLSGAARLRAAATRHPPITTDSIRTISALYGPLYSDLKQESSLDLGHVVDKHTNDTGQVNNISLDDTKTEVMSEEIVDEESTGVGVDISSLQDDITKEVMRAAYDDGIDDEVGDEAGDGASDAIWMAGLHAVEVKNEDVFNDSVGEDIKCEYEKDLVDGDDSSYPSVVLDRTTRKRRKRRTEETEAELTNIDIASRKCPYKAKTVANLLDQLRSDSETKYYNCNECDYETTKKRYLTRHKKVHSGKVRYSCHVCKRLFSFKCNLHNHMRIHTGEKPYSCSVCNKPFARSDHLKMHLNIHTGEKSYACDVCDKAFRTKNVLRQHVALHSGERTFSCEYCNRNFNRKCNLQAHLRTHSGEKPFSCNLCNKPFSLQCNLKDHLKKHCNGD